MFRTLDHPAIACHDVKRQIAWYCEQFGMRVIVSNGQEPPAVLVGWGESPSGGAMIELMPIRDAGPEPASIGRWAPGMRHIAFAVRDFDGAARQLQSAGVSFLGDVGAAVGGGRVWSFRDPEGNELQIVERLNPEP